MVHGTELITASGIRCNDHVFFSFQQPTVFAIMTTSFFLFNNQRDALIIQIYSVIKLYMFQASSLPIIRGFLLYIRYW